MSSIPVMEIWAPHPAAETMIILPQPSLRDSFNFESRVMANVAMNGTQFTHVKRQDVQKLYKWQFNVTRYKSLEFWNFVKLYSAEKWKIVQDDGTEIVGYYKVNPTQLNVAHRAILADSVESVLFEIEFLKVE